MCTRDTCAQPVHDGPAQNSSALVPRDDLWPPSLRILRGRARVDDRLRHCCCVLKIFFWVYQGHVEARISVQELGHDAPRVASSHDHHTDLSRAFPFDLFDSPRSCHALRELADQGLEQRSDFFEGRCKAGQQLLIPPWLGSDARLVRFLPAAKHGRDLGVRQWELIGGASREESFSNGAETDPGPSEPSGRKSASRGGGKAQRVAQLPLVVEQSHGVLPHAAAVRRSFELLQELRLIQDPLEREPRRICSSHLLHCQEREVNLFIFIDLGRARFRLMAASRRIGGPLHQGNALHQGKALLRPGRHRQVGRANDRAVRQIFQASHRSLLPATDPDCAIVQKEHELSVAHEFQ